MTEEEYQAWLAECIRDNVCTYHRVKDCGCYYWTNIKLENGIDSSKPGVGNGK